MIYNGVVEASSIPPGWHAWIHHRADTAPTDDGYRPHDWQKPHEPNLTGTPQYVSWVTRILRPNLGDRVLEIGAGSQSGVRFSSARMRRLTTIAATTMASTATSK